MLAGVSFETAPQPLPVTLPRMDVAAFVGFAATGPLDVPVVIEDVGRFRDIFGARPALALDRQTGVPVRGYLGPAVEAYFASGGRRCWVVRVAENPVQLEFELPGLLALGGDLENPLRGRARSRGTAARAMTVGTTLLAEALTVDNSNQPVLRIEADARGTQFLELDLRLPLDKVTAGDLLELSVLKPGLSEVRLFVVVDRAISSVGGIRVRALRYSVTTASAESTTHSRVLMLAQPAEAAAIIAQLQAVDSVALRVFKLNLELSVYENEQLVYRIGGLGFAAPHPRFWGYLPSDTEAFWGAVQPPVGTRADEFLAFFDEALGQRRKAVGVGARCPVCGPTPPVAQRAWPVYLPSGMAQRRDVTDSVAPLALDAALGTAGGDGLDRLHADLFVDSRLAGYSGDNLRRTAEHIHNQARDWWRTRRNVERYRLRGVHALFPVEEVTLLAIPDLTHSGWSSRLASLAAPLEAPELLRVGEPDAAGRVWLSWTGVPAATSYELFWDESPEFGSASLAFSGQALEVRVSLPESCARERFFRVRAMRHSEPSPWSNTRILRARPGEFLDCDRLVLPELTLSLGVGSLGEPTLVTSSQPEASASVSYRLQIAEDALFETIASETEDTAQSQVNAPALFDGPRYARVRAETPAEFGTWSNTVVLLPTEPHQPETIPIRTDSDYDDSTLLAVHRATVRFCEARGDIVALLAVPKHFGEARLTRHLAALRPAQALADLAEAATQSPHQPLSMGEAATLSYAALYHPWVALILGESESSVEFIPPEACAAALLARTALERGAWTASANRAIPGVLALEPRLDLHAVSGLTKQQVNLVGTTPRGFTLRDDQTLSSETDTRPMAVKRLLILLKRLALREGTRYVFEPNDPDFPVRVRHRFERVLSGLYVRGALRGATEKEAFRVTVDESVNPPTNVETGRFVVELAVAPSRPLRFLRVRLVQTEPQVLGVGEF